ncbi:synaptotagmin-4-like [Tachypleus tridentatus]|uniref:synaptotagmin-4-like n=1 Tax=Tachypleus tridentatus TaxID=6853 RepID=UPI003FD4DB7F
MKISDPMMIYPTKNGEKITSAHEVTTATIVGICVGSILAIFTFAVLSYYCYRRRASRETRELTAIFKKGLPREPLVPRKSKPVRSASTGLSGVKESPSPTIHKSSSDGRGNGLSLFRQLATTVPEDEIMYHVGQRKTIDNDKTPTFAEEKEVTEEKPTKLGKLHFRFKYIKEKRELLVTIVGCTDLPVKDLNTGTADPYVKLQLLPEKQHKVKTRVLRKTLKPVYDEDFTFYGINSSQVQTTTLHFIVLSFDRYSRDDVIGEVIYPLPNLEDEMLEKQNTVEREISPRSLKIRSQGRGELLVSLCYQPAASRLTVVILKARKLPKLDVTGLCNPYVKIYLMYNKQRIAKKKTLVKKRTLDPVFNESFIFEAPYNEGLENISLELVVLDWDRVTKNEVIGRLNIGSKTGGTTQQHWADVSHSPRRQIAEWHKLQE